jgi:hypothetical protein
MYTLVYAIRAREVYLVSMKKLIEYTPQGCTHPVALVSNNLPPYILKVIDNNWDVIASGLGTHCDVDSFSQPNNLLG